MRPATRSTVVVLAFTGLCFGGPRDAGAAPCDGFVDVDDANATYCAAVTYMKNTGITAGCTNATHFCPNDAVTRLQMALFMQRMANGAVFRQGGNAFGAAATLGTTDNQALTLLVDGQPMLRGTSKHDGSAINILGGHATNLISAGTSGVVIAGGGKSGSDCGDTGDAQCYNLATDSYDTVSGGLGNTASGLAAVVAGGHGSASVGEGAVVGGGLSNYASAKSAAVGGGQDNWSAGIGASIPGGYANTAGGAYATVAGGYLNSAAGTFSVVLGKYGMTGPEGSGSFVFSDSTSSASAFGTDVPNQFVVAASGGIRMQTSKTSPATGCSIAAGGGTWSCSSSRTMKRDFTAVDTQDVLDKVAALPVMRWRYNGEDAGLRHLGTFAEDFHAAFGLGADDKSISMADADGVALAAIQALYARARRAESALAARDTQLADMTKRLERLERLEEQAR